MALGLLLPAALLTQVRAKPADFAAFQAQAAARQATEGFATRRQLALGLIDLAFHAVPAADAQKMDVVAVSNAVLKRVSVAPPADTALVAYFGHLAGYDAGYQWAVGQGARDRHGQRLPGGAGRLPRREGRPPAARRGLRRGPHPRRGRVGREVPRPRAQEPYLAYVGIKATK
ncbi:M3 family metallopeptidase [Opitutus sp. GAS368]|uniref:M3 family metallopeptidase n=1 Tax=Opitutus sp. GAS368 TaxID=1882749 RepID=UPI0015600605|nr:M3 family metallopeptidase [Opitutus sp. GAS368]